jgi:class 3 adenylate cyclase
MDVVAWLHGLGLERYAPAFQAHDIEMAVLAHLTADDLVQLGVASVGHRRTLLTAIAALRDGAAQPEAERRQVTIMFCDLVGSTALAARLDPEDMREVMTGYQAAVSSEIVRFGGFVAKYMGDGVLVYFGYPRANEDDAERAARAGLGVLAAVARLRAPGGEALQVRIGVATGQVVMGDVIGEGAARELAVVGDAANVAARLQSLAAPGSVLVASSTRRLLGGLFHLRALGPQALKGLAEPVEVWEILGATAPESRFEAVRTASAHAGLVGRAQEAGLLLDRQRRAWQGEGQVVLVSGEPGIGKSHLAAWLCDQIAAGPHARLRYQCSPYHRDSPLHPLVAQIERVSGIEARDAPAQKLDKLAAAFAATYPDLEPAAVVPLFAALLAIPSDGRYAPLRLSPAQQRRDTLAAGLSLIERLARRQPVLLLFEDAHWADATSVELMGSLCERVRGLPVLAIITFRPEFEPPWPKLPHVAALALDRLGEEEVGAVVQGVAHGRTLPEEVLRQLVAKADGNPLFAEELTKAVLESGVLTETPGEERWRLSGNLPPLAVPATLQDSLTARLDRLAPAKAVAQAGAVIGRDFSYALLSSVAGRDEAALGAALAQLEEAGLVLRSGSPPGASYSFKHALIRDAAYEGLLRSRRQVLHRRVGEVLRDSFPARAEAEPEIVAQHFTLAGLAAPAVEWWERAGALALRRSGYPEATGHFGKAIDLAEGLGEGPAPRLLRLRLQVAYGQAMMVARGWNAPGATAAFLRARELAEGIEDASERHVVYSGLWSGAWTRGEISLMEALAEAFLRDAEVRPGVPEEATACMIGGMTHWFRGDFDAARPHLERGSAIGGAPGGFIARFGHDPCLASLIYLALTLWLLGEVDRAGRLFEEAVIRAERHGHVPSLCAAAQEHRGGDAGRGRPGPRAIGQRAAPRARAGPVAVHRLGAGPARLGRLAPRRARRLGRDGGVARFRRAARRRGLEAVPRSPARGRAGCGAAGRRAAPAGRGRAGPGAHGPALGRGGAAPRARRVAAPPRAARDGSRGGRLPPRHRCCPAPGGTDVRAAGGAAAGAAARRQRARGGGARPARAGPRRLHRHAGSARAGRGAGAARRAAADGAQSPIGVPSSMMRSASAQKRGKSGWSPSGRPRSLAIGWLA